jgi:hypothetical protein
MFTQLKTKIFDPGSYLTVLFLTIIAFVLFHGIIYLFFTSKILNIKAPYHRGDLSRMSYQVGSVVYRKMEPQLAKQHITGANYKAGMPVDVVTIGDSFSNGGGSGKNPFYQDYIATLNNLEVLNIRLLPQADSILGTTMALINSGVLNEISPKVLLIEAGSRYFLEWFSRPIPKQPPLEKASIYSSISKMGLHYASRYSQQNISFINSGNYKFVSNTLQYNFKTCLSCDVCRLPLEKELFNADDANVLEFYDGNVKVIPDTTKERVAIANETFNLIADMLSRSGIKLYVMVVVDKFDLYSSYLSKNPFGENPLFSLLRPMDKRYTFIDTKKILLEELVNNETKDLFFADDTHWTYKASEAIFKQVRFSSN